MTPSTPNDFLTRLFEQYNALAAQEIAETQKEQEAYETAIAQGQEIIASIVDVESANAAIPKMKAITHALTSKQEINVAFNAKIAELGLVYDQTQKKYVPAQAQENAKGAK